MENNSYEINDKFLLNAELSVGTILGELMYSFAKMHNF